jgi:hypothetical protein
VFQGGSKAFGVGVWKNIRRGRGVFSIFVRYEVEDGPRLDFSMICGVGTSF